MDSTALDSKIFLYLLNSIIIIIYFYIDHIYYFFLWKYFILLRILLMYIINVFLLIKKFEGFICGSTKHEMSWSK